jgi:DeoR/GlpR family transcriptional regulator of sugar metabolism
MCDHVRTQPGRLVRAGVYGTGPIRATAVDSSITAAHNPLVPTQSAVDERLLDLLRRRGTRSVTEIAGTLDVGEATVRRSLRRLAGSGRVIRTYGGAVLTGERTTHAPTEAWPNAQAKREIGAAAASLVPDGATVVLSSGSTVLELAIRLRGRRLTAITNAIDVVTALADEPEIEVVVLGGMLLPRSRSLIGHLTDRATRDLRADIVFMGASAVDLEHGFMTEEVGEIQTDRAMRGIARECVVLADASKLDRVAPGFMFGFDQVGTLVTDGRLRPAMRAALAERGLRVVTAPSADLPIETAGSNGSES